MLIGDKGNILFEITNYRVFVFELHIPLTGGNHGILKILEEYFLQGRC